jgi:hypothetical protein
MAGRKLGQWYGVEDTGKKLRARSREGRRRVRSEVREFCVVL